DGYFFEKEESAIVKAVDKNNPGVRKIIAWVSTVAAMIIIGLFAVSPQQQKDSIDNEEMAWVYLSENVDSWDIDDMISSQAIDEALLEEWEADQFIWLDSLNSEVLFEE